MSRSAKHASGDSPLGKASERVRTFIAEMEEWEVSATKLHDARAPFTDIIARGVPIIEKHCVGPSLMQELHSFGTPPKHDTLKENIGLVSTVDDDCIEVSTFYDLGQFLSHSRVYFVHRIGDDWKIAEVVEVECENELPEIDRTLTSTAASLTTRSPDVNLAAEISELRALEQTTVRLHPRFTREVSASASKIGGTFLGNSCEQWVHCRDHNTPYAAVLQICRGDVPEIGFREGCDVFQLLWCPFDHDGGAPAVAVRWLDSRQLGENLPHNPALRKPRYCNTVPQCCRLLPERVLEYPDVFDISSELTELIESNRAMQKFGLHYFSDYDEASKAALRAYQCLYSVAPGTKIGGHVDWIQNPAIPECQCGRPMEHLLTIASWEWDGATWHRWRPMEEDGDGHIEDAKLMLGDAGSIYVFICRHCPDWPIQRVSQCS